MFEFCAFFLFHVIINSQKKRRQQTQRSNKMSQKGRKKDADFEYHLVSQQLFGIFIEIREAFKDFVQHQSCF